MPIHFTVSKTPLVSCIRQDADINVGNAAVTATALYCRAVSVVDEERQEHSVDTQRRNEFVRLSHLMAAANESS